MHLSDAQSSYLICNARVLDGTGAPWFRADVLLAAGRIARISPTSNRPSSSPAPSNSSSPPLVSSVPSLPSSRPSASSSPVLIDGDGCYLSPGFIDSHCHDDLALLRQPDRREKLKQGITTSVIGNCSFSLYPAAPADGRRRLREHFGSLLGAVDDDEVFDDWQSYAAALHGRGVGLNVVSLVGHAALRLTVIGQSSDVASESQIRDMQALLAAQLQQGAAGLSLGLGYFPSSAASMDELIALASTTASYGRVVAAHVRDYTGGLLQSVDEFIHVLRQSGAAGLLSHVQAAGQPNWDGKLQQTLEKLQQARREGIDVTADMYPYTAGSSTLLQLLPTDALEGGIDALLARLDDAAYSKWLCGAVEGTSLPASSPCKVRDIGWHSVALSGVGHPSLKPLEGLRMDEAARQTDLSPFDLLLHCLRVDRGVTSIVLHQLSPADVRLACCHPLTAIGSDGLPRPGTKVHPRAFGAAARAAGQSVRDGWWTLEEAVRKMTAMPAARFGLQSRGVLMEGMVADVLLFDAEAVSDEATYEEPTREAAGMRWVWVAGVAVVEEGHLNERTAAGRMLTAVSPSSSSETITTAATPITIQPEPTVAARIHSLSLDDCLLDSSYKGFPHFSPPLLLSAVASQHWNALTDLPPPFPILRRSALLHNAAWMAAFCASRGVRLAPHGKTSCSPQLWRLQMAAGAWGMTVASAKQAEACARLAIRNVLIANQIVEAHDVALLARLACDESELVDVHFLLDSIPQLRLIEAAVTAGGLLSGGRKLNALLELGYEGGRTGVRSVEQALQLAEAVASSPAVLLSGVETYEGMLVRGQPSDAAALDTLFSTLLSLVSTLADRRYFARPSILVSAGGSAAFDLVADWLSKAGRLSLGRPVVPLLRSGCYLTHDHGLYQSFGQHIADRLTTAVPPSLPLPGTVPPPASFLVPALEVWGAVLSVPQPRLAIVGMGRRDASSDQQLPQPLYRWRRSSSSQPEPWRGTTSRLMDQHAYVEWDERAAEGDSGTSSGGEQVRELRVGDMVGFGVSHPCTTFDKWRWMPLVDERYELLGGITCHF